MIRSKLLAAAGLLSLVAQMSGAEADAVVSPEMSSHPDYDVYKSTIHEGSTDSLRRFLSENPSSPFAGQVFLKLVQEIDCTIDILNQECATSEDPLTEMPDTASVYG